MKTRVGILGFGKIGEAITVGLLQSKLKKNFTVSGTTRSDTSAKDISKRLNIKCSTNNQDLVKNNHWIILSIKPYQAKEVLSEISSQLTKDHILVSVCASITLNQLEEWSGHRCTVIRAMPNTPSLIGQGMTALCAQPGISTKTLNQAEEIFKCCGKTALVDESLMDGVTGLSGCGPAYAFLIIEALSEAGVKVGLSRKTATLMAAQTLLGASELVLRRGEHPAALKDEVTTPAGCTIDGLMALEEGKLRVTLIKAVLAATRRSQKLRGA